MKPALYAALVERSGGHCENPDCRKAFGIGLLTQEADHVFGRARAADSLDTLWLICRGCHFERTNNRPDAETWFRRFLVHCEKYGYRNSYDRAFKELGWRLAKKKAGAA